MCEYPLICSEKQNLFKELFLVDGIYGNSNTLMFLLFTICYLLISYEDDFYELVFISVYVPEITLPKLCVSKIKKTNAHNVITHDLSYYYNNQVLEECITITNKY